MRPLVIVFMAEVIKGPLLASRSCFGRIGCLGFEFAVHAFMAAVLFGVAGLDAFGLDAELYPTEAQPRETAEARRGKGRPVVATHDLGEAVVAKDALQEGLHAVEANVGEALATEHVATVVVA